MVGGLPNSAPGSIWYEIALEYWGPLAVRARDVFVEKLIPAQIAKAEGVAAD